MYLPNSFKVNSFLPVSFRFTGVVPPTNGGRSGYWRLFYTNLQEESLKKDAESKETPKSDPVVQVKRPKTKRRVAKRVPRVSRPEVPEVERTPFKLYPVAVAANTYDKLTEITPLPELMFSAATYNNVISINSAKIKRDKRNRRRAAAFLLLAA